MIKDFSFQDVRKYLEKSNDNAILDVFDKLADAALIFAPVVFGVQFLPLLELLDAKDRLSGLARTVVNFIAARQEPEYIDRLEQLRTAYSLICYTAYFESLEEILPKDIRKILKVNYEKKVELADSSSQDIGFCRDVVELDVHNELPYTDHVTSFSETQSKLTELYRAITDKIVKMIKESDVRTYNEQKYEVLKKSLEIELPKRAIERYRAQYLYLADIFSDFGFFAQGIEFSSLHNAAQKHSQALKLIEKSTKGIDVGLTNLYNIIKCMPSYYAAIQTQDIVNDLKSKYKAMIEQPIIDDKEIFSKQEEIKLTFPKIVDAFIPQSYKCISYDTKVRLEDEKTWKRVEVKDDLDRFFIKYLCSADSLDTPLIILGHPGSGKSLLTKVLSAQLMSESYTAIRIPLREVNAESTIDLLVEDQIKKVTQLNLPQGGYGVFAKQFKDKPILIILDGYDELLQAKGDVFAAYLDKAMRFQQNQKELNRPVRIIVTSRITLIDKAIVPINSTVLRLLEFNARQMNEWIRIWNRTNNYYFRSCIPRIMPFSLPTMEKNLGSDKKNSILELAEQPLLLLMLALYDSEGNSLSNLDYDLKRTALYNNLLRRFIRRERSRYVAGFNEKSREDQNTIIDIEMKRLGVVAIGMFNRKKLYINTKELENDLKVFETRRIDEEASGRKLKDSESLLGEFFFIHQSTAQDVSANSDNSDSTFEFLHNTFGEFLTADMILRFAIEETQAIGECKKSKCLANDYERKINSPDGLCTEWFACLIFTPLYSRPVVLEMIKEHASRAMRESGMKEREFYENFEILIKSQLRIILTTIKYPKVMHGHGISNDTPLLGYISIYTLNLIIIASVLCEKEFVFNEDEYIHHVLSSSETKPWDKLISLWKTWFTADNLVGISTILWTERHGNKIIIRRHEKYESNSLTRAIDVQLCVSYALSDNMNMGLAALQSRSISRVLNLGEYVLERLLADENIDMYYAFIVQRLRKCVHSYEADDLGNDQIKSINNTVKAFAENINLYDFNMNTLLDFFEIAEICIERHALYTGTKNNVLNMALECMRLCENISEKDIPIYNIATRIVNKMAFGGALYYMESNADEERMHIINRVLYKAIETRCDKRETNPINAKRILGTFSLDIQEMLCKVIEHDTQQEIDKILYSFVLSKNFKKLALVNPLLTTKILLKLKDNRGIENVMREIVSIILDEIKTNGLRFIEDEVIINVIEISKSITDVDIKDSLALCFVEFLKKQRNSVIDSMLNTRPDLFNALMDILPGIVFEEGIFPKHLEQYYDVKRRGYVPQLKNILSYMKIARKMSAMQDKPTTTIQCLQELIDDGIRNYVDCVQSRDYIGKIKIEDIDDIAWYSLRYGNGELFRIIQARIAEHV